MNLVPDFMHEPGEERKVNKLWPMEEFKKWEEADLADLQADQLVCDFDIDEDDCCTVASDVAEELGLLSTNDHIDSYASDNDHIDSCTDRALNAGRQESYNPCRKGEKHVNQHSPQLQSCAAMVLMFVFFMQPRWLDLICFSP